jgi:hypothetical protein
MWMRTQTQRSRNAVEDQKHTEPDRHHKTQRMEKAIVSYQTINFYGPKKRVARIKTNPMTPTLPSITHTDQV